MTRTFTQGFNRLDDDETDITVEYTVGRYYPATWEQPAEGGEIEIVQAWINGGTSQIIELTPAEHDKFHLWLMENHNQRWHGDDY